MAGSLELLVDNDGDLACIGDAHLLDVLDDLASFVVQFESVDELLFTEGVQAVVEDIQLERSTVASDRQNDENAELAAISQAKCNFALVVEVLDGQEAYQSFVLFRFGCGISGVEAKTSLESEDISELACPRDIFCPLAHDSCAFPDEDGNRVCQLVLDGNHLSTFIHSSTLIVEPVVSLWEIDTPVGSIFDQDWCKHQLSSDSKLSLSNLISQHIRIIRIVDEQRSEDGTKTSFIDKVPVIEFEQGIT